MAAVLCRGMNANVERSVFYMFGGSIYKNATDGDGGEIYKNMTPKGNGGGIYINGEKSSLTARSGSISENVSILGGGIFVGNASFRLEGAVIMQNKATQNDSGVYNDGNMTVDGSGFIYSNYQTDEVSYDAKAGAPSNLYLPNGKIINIGKNGLKKTKIWVTTEGGKVNITSSHNIDYDCNKIFRIDDTKYAIDSESGIIKLMDGYAVTFDYRRRQLRNGVISPK